MHIMSSFTVVFFKKGDPLLVKNYRPISLLSGVYKPTASERRVGHTMVGIRLIDHRSNKWLGGINECLAKDRRSLRLHIFVMRLM
uniref:DUF1330 domain-containing protein n=1 Tax=Steinernema glaseri TaxID=37863 RepID=A0A1I8A3C0_9BILA